MRPNFKRKQQAFGVSRSIYDTTNNSLFLMKAISNHKDALELEVAKHLFCYKNA